MAAPLSPSRIVYGFTSASDPNLSPDGSQILYTLSATDAATQAISSQVWVCDFEGANPRRLTWTGERNAGARWSPDGSQAAFVSNRVPASGLFVMPMQGGEARELARHGTMLGDLAWSPDGSRIAYTAVVDPANTGDIAASGPPTVRVTSRIDYKQDNRGYLGDARRQIFVVDVATGERRQVTSDAVDHQFPVWSPDGTRLLASVSTHNGMRSKLRIIPVAGGDPVEFGWERGNAGTWAWSPDGSRVVFSGEPMLTYQPDYYVYELASGDIRQVTRDLPCYPASGFPTIEPPSMPVWLDDHRILFPAYHHASSGLWELNVDSGEVQQVEGSQCIRSGFSVDAARRHVVQGYSSLETTGELWAFDRKAGSGRVITSYAAPTLSETPMAGWERFDVSRSGRLIEAWMLRPADFDAAKKYPVVLDIHGGPNGYYGYAFNGIQQCLATNGFVVVFGNPGGSTTYGREFTQLVTEDWGGEDYLDLIAVLDEALKRPYCDAERTGIWGYSYGGYMTAWTIAQNHRFKAAVCGAPCFDLEAMYGTSDISHEFGELQWGGPPHQSREWYATHSPSQIAHNTRTPTLIIQGEADDRCPVGQGEAMFVALKKAGVETEFARYPGGSHLFMRVGPPAQREDVLARVLAWFQSHLF
jgi:dipeptidyl aminopeptidase/acylaminoacyl peptidase